MSIKRWCGISLPTVFHNWRNSTSKQLFSLQTARLVRKSSTHQEMETASANSYPQLPPYLRSCNYPSPNLGYDPYCRVAMARTRSQSISPPLTSSAAAQYPLPAIQPPVPPAAPALPPICPSMHLFRPIDFDSRAASRKPQSIQATYHMPPTPSDSERGSRTPSPSGTSSVIGKDANYCEDGITISLLEADLWCSFSSVGNEMIVTKPGRRLFPSLLVSLRGLEPQTNYEISLRIIPVDQYRYKFLSMRWVAVGESEVLQDEKRQAYKHPNSPKSGYFWMKKPISFKPCKISHNPRSKHGNILLHTMHKYVMNIIVTPVESERKPTTICLKATEFVAVSAYQNTALTQLKIDNNPFAKGFRDRDIVPATSHTAFPHAYPGWDNALPLPSLPGIIPEPVNTIELTPEPSTGSSHSPSPTFSASGNIPPLVDYPSQPPVDYSKPLRLPYPLPYPIPPPLVSMPASEHHQEPLL